MNKLGYLYVRINDWLILYNICKIGITDNIIERNNTYKTGEPKEGKYILVIEIENNKMNTIEKLIHNYFKKYKYQNTGGKEFFSNEIINEIIPFLELIKIKFRKLSNEEIEELKRKDRVKKAIELIKKLIKLNKKNKYVQREYQTEIINKTIKYFDDNNRGILVLPCGTGKTLISLWIAKQINANKIIIGVPNIQLLMQWIIYIKKVFFNYEILKIFENITENDIINFIDNNKQYVIITTYQSAYKLNNVCKTNEYIFDFKILDECHHLTSKNIKEKEDDRRYITILNIQSNKQLALTATLKNIENIEDNNEIVSNNNEEYFGKIIERICLLWAINRIIICDYDVITLIANIEQLNNILRELNITDISKQRLFLSAYTAIKTLQNNQAHHLLVYCNTIENANIINQYINLLIEHKYFEIDDMYYSIYNSKQNKKLRSEILTIFEKAKCGILVNVYCLGEGYDLPLLDGVVFADNMLSNIRIVQSFLRACRKNINEPNKRMRIILPILNNENWIEDKIDYKKVREVIYQIGLEDETIEQKVKLYNLDITKYNKNNENSKIEFEECDDKIKDNIKLFIRERKQLQYFSYEKAKKTIREHNIKNIDEYIELCEKDNRLSKEPDEYYKGTWLNWCDYLSIERIYYNIDECIKKVNEYLILYPELKKNWKITYICEKLCKLDEEFPPNELWIDYYRNNNIKSLDDIIKINNNKKILKTF